MSEMFEQVPLTERTQDEVAARRVSAAAQYWELLLKEHPDAGDEQATLEVLAVLGRDVRKVGEDQALVQRIAECERLAESISTLDADLQGKHVEWVQAIAWAEKARVDLEGRIKARL